MVLPSPVELVTALSWKGDKLIMSSLAAGKTVWRGIWSVPWEAGCSISKAQMMAAKYKPRKIPIAFNKEQRNLLRSF